VGMADGPFNTSVITQNKFAYVWEKSARSRFKARVQCSLLKACNRHAGQTDPFTDYE
jgi:hypothetical protein